jgi:hypothetical protein
MDKPLANIFAAQEPVLPDSTAQKLAGTKIEGQAQLDLTQLAPVVSAWQSGEIEKARLQQETNVAVAEMNLKRQMEVDKNVAARELRQDRYEGGTTGALFIGCLAMMGYGMWAHDPGFITAGVTSFATFLAGKRVAAAKPKQQ